MVLASKPKISRREVINFSFLVLNYGKKSDFYSGILLDFETFFSGRKRQINRF